MTKTCFLSTFIQKSSQKNVPGPGSGYLITANFRKIPVVPGAYFGLHIRGHRGTRTTYFFTYLDSPRACLLIKKEIGGVSILVFV